MSKAQTSYILKNARLITHYTDQLDDNPAEQCMKVEADSVSDGYHTMEELYEHRFRLYLALVKIYDNYETPLKREVKCWKSRLHPDGSSYEGMFLLGMTVVKVNFTGPPDTFDISYHIPNKYWHLANVIEYPKAPPYDDYTSDDVLERLLRL